ncbi:HEL105Cp [Eremothecium sinecaudum]|uniref:HEL105Cp n=1 Tax=Eremothecium sinecaudum TaxID=45286 RepID=A0A0X8HTG4_9SACH|nr:HEL105Cp [Eremothecium sinecaudum]AMD21175.1 HEL105Cp [Eremothecium sinecaudum]
MGKIHLIVLVHGLWGNSSHMDYLVNALKQLSVNSKERLEIYSTQLNQGYRTYDGIDICGYRVADEIEERLVVLNSVPTDVVTKFSLVGYSMGGLIARYAIGILYAKQKFQNYKLELINFTTFCSPHIGVYAPGTNITAKIFNNVCPMLAGNTGQQLFLKDRVRQVGSKPLVYIMSMEDSVFYRALELFKHRSLYANIINDNRTAWWTSGISINNPFFDINIKNGVSRLQFLPGYGPVVDNNSKVKVAYVGNHLNDTTLSSEKESKRLLHAFVADVYGWFAVLINLLIFTPLYIVYLLASNTVHSFNSAIRVSRFLKRYSNKLMKEYFDSSYSVSVCNNESLFRNDINCLYNKPSAATDYENQIAQSLDEQTDTLIQSVLHAVEHKNLLGANLVEGSETGDLFPATIAELETNVIEEMPLGDKDKEILRPCKINIGPIQIEIIKSLNKLSWRKFPIYIRDTPNVHSCAIVRHNDPSYWEGEIVVRHWCEQVFKLD